MPAKPVLSDYPRLRAILQQDPVANQQFNAILSGKGIERPGCTQQTVSLDLSLREKNIELQQSLEAQDKRYQVLMEFVRQLGGAIEEQVDLKPYEPLPDRRTMYTIRLEQSQVKALLVKYWDSLAAHLENEIAGRAAAMDPARGRRKRR